MEAAAFLGTNRRLSIFVATRSLAARKAVGQFGTPPACLSTSR